LKKKKVGKNRGLHVLGRRKKEKKKRGRDVSSAGPCLREGVTGSQNARPETTKSKKGEKKNGKAAPLEEQGEQGATQKRSRCNRPWGRGEVPNRHPTKKKSKGGRKEKISPKGKLSGTSQCRGECWGRKKEQRLVRSAGKERGEEKKLKA